MADKLDSLVQQNSGSQPSRTAAQQQIDTKDLLSQIVSTERDIAGLRKAQAEVPGPDMTSLAGIIAMLGAGGAAAAGDPAAGVGVLDQFTQQGLANQKAQRGMLQDEREESIKMLEANRQRLTTMLTSRPEMFVDSETGEALVDPRVLMYTATGFMMPINPGINYKLSKQTDHTKQLVSLGTDLVLHGDTPGKRVQGGLLINKALGLNLDDQFFADIVGMDETAAWDSLLSKQGLDPVATLHAWEYARQNGMTLADPEIISMLAKAEIPEGGELTLDKYTVSLIQKLNKGIEEGGPALQSKSLEDQIAFVFGDTAEGDGAVLLRYFKGTDAFGTGIDGTQLWQMMAGAGQLLSTLYTTQPHSKFLTDRGITSPEDIWSEKGVGSVVSSSIAWAQQAQRDAFAQGYGSQLREVAKALAARYTEAGRQVSYPELLLEADGVVSQYRQEATSSTGRVDVDAFNKKVKAYVDGPAPQGQ